MAVISRVQHRTDWVRARIDAGRRWVERTFVWRIWERMLENEFVDRSVALGAKAFVSFFPFVIVVVTFLPSRTRNSVVHTIQRRFGLSGPSLATVRDAFASSGDIHRATGLLGLFLLVFYATSFTTALRRVFVKVWRRPPVGQVSKYTSGPIWMGGVLAFAALLGELRGVLVGGPGTVLYGLLSTGVSIGLWWATAWLMLRGQVRWRPLLPTGVLTGVGLSVFAATASLWMPHTVASDQHQFGFFGVALALVSWFSGAASVVLIAACAGASLVDEEGWLGRYARGGETPILKPGAPPSLPPPTRRLRAVNALGIHTDDQPDDAPT
jgi:membrane protein